MPLLPSAAAVSVGAAAAAPRTMTERRRPGAASGAACHPAAACITPHRHVGRRSAVRHYCVNAQSASFAGPRSAPPHSGSACPTSPKGVHAHLAQHVVQQRLAQQHAVSHVLDHRLLAGAVLKADGVADLRAQEGGGECMPSEGWRWRAGRCIVGASWRTAEVASCGALVRRRDGCTRKFACIPASHHPWIRHATCSCMSDRQLAAAYWAGCSRQLLHSSL